MGFKLGCINLLMPPMLKSGVALAGDLVPDSRSICLYFTEFSKLMNVIAGKCKPSLHLYR